MKAEKDRIEMAGLLDGEISDLGQVELLGKEIEKDAALKTEFEEQRRVKALLASLPEYEAPDFLATRVMGEIVAGSSRRQTRRWRTVAVLASSLVLCFVAVGLAIQLKQPPNPRPEINYASLTDETDMASRDLQPWISEEAAFEPVVDDERVMEFLEFVDEMHRYRALLRSAENISPNLPEAIMVLDEEE